MITIEIINGPIAFFPNNNYDQETGSELIFNGRVRSTENGKPIVALEYEQYEGMAKSELIQLAEETRKKFPIDNLFCKHRIGRVGVGETSLHVVILSHHRKEGLEGMSWFIKELKKRIPIWKWAVLEDGTRIPSNCVQEH